MQKYSLGQQSSVYTKFFRVKMGISTLPHNYNPEDSDSTRPRIGDYTFCYGVIPHIGLQSNKI